MDNFITLIDELINQPNAFALGIAVVMFGIAKILINLGGFIKMKAKQIAQTFTQYEDEYSYDSKTDTVQLTGKVDCQEKIQSCKDSTFESLMKRLQGSVGGLDGLTVDDKNVAQVNLYQDEMEELNEIIDTANEYREKYNLPIDMSISDIYKHIQSESNNYKKELEKAQKAKEEELEKAQLAKLKEKYEKGV